MIFDCKLVIFLFLTLLQVGLVCSAVIEYQIDATPNVDGDGDNVISAGDTILLSAALRGLTAGTYVLNQPFDDSQFKLVDASKPIVGNAPFTPALPNSQTIKVTGKTAIIKRISNLLLANSQKFNIDYVFSFSVAIDADGFYPLINTCAGGKFKVLADGSFLIISPPGFMQGNGNNYCNGISGSSPSFGISFQIVHKATNVASAVHAFSVDFVQELNFLFVDNSFTGTTNTGHEEFPFNSMNQLSNKLVSGFVGAGSRIFVVIKGSPTTYPLTEKIFGSTEINAEITLWGTFKAQTIGSQLSDADVEYPAIPKVNSRTTIAVSNDIFIPDTLILQSIDFISTTNAEIVNEPGATITLCGADISFNKVSFAHTTGTCRLGFGCEIKLTAINFAIFEPKFQVNSYDANLLQFTGVGQSNPVLFGPVATKKISLKDTEFNFVFEEDVNIDGDDADPALIISPSASTLTETIIFKKKLTINNDKGILLDRWADVGIRKPKVIFEGDVLITASGTTSEVFAIKQEPPTSISLVATPAYEIANFNSIVTITRTSATSIALPINNAAISVLSNALANQPTFKYIFKENVVITGFNVGVLSSWAGLLMFENQLQIQNTIQFGIRIQASNGASSPRGAFVSAKDLHISSTLGVGVNIINNPNNFKLTATSSSTINIPNGIAISAITTDASPSVQLTLGNTQITAERAIVATNVQKITTAALTATIVKSNNMYPMDCTKTDVLITGAFTWTQSGVTAGILQFEEINQSFIVQGPTIINYNGNKNTDSAMPLMKTNANGASPITLFFKDLEINTNGDAVLLLVDTNINAGNVKIVGRCTSDIPACNEPAIKAFATAGSALVVDFETVQIGVNEVSNRLAFDIGNEVKLQLKNPSTIRCAFDHPSNQNKYCIKSGFNIDTGNGCHTIFSRNSRALSSSGNAGGAVLACYSIDVEEVAPLFYNPSSSAIAATPGASVFYSTSFARSITFPQLNIKAKDKSLILTGTIGPATIEAGQINMELTPNCLVATCAAITAQIPNGNGLIIKSLNIFNFPTNVATSYKAIITDGRSPLKIDAGLLRIANIKNTAIETDADVLTVNNFDITIQDIPFGKDFRCFLITKTANTLSTVTIGKVGTTSICSTSTAVPVKAIKYSSTATGGAHSVTIDSVSTSNFHFIDFVANERRTDFTLTRCTISGIKFEKVAADDETNIAYITAHSAVSLRKQALTKITNSFFKTDNNANNALNRKRLLFLTPPSIHTLGGINLIENNDFGAIFNVAASTNSYNLIAIQFYDKMVGPNFAAPLSPYNARVDIKNNIFKSSIAIFAFKHQKQAGQNLDRVILNINSNTATLQPSSSSELGFIIFSIDSSITADSFPNYCITSVVGNTINNLCNSSIKLLHFKTSIDRIAIQGDPRESWNDNSNSPAIILPLTCANYDSDNDVNNCSTVT